MTEPHPTVPEPALEEVTDGPVPFVLSRRRRASARSPNPFVLSWSRRVSDGSASKGRQ